MSCFLIRALHLFSLFLWALLCRDDQSQPKRKTFSLPSPSCNCVLRGWGLQKEQIQTGVAATCLNREKHFTAVRHQQEAIPLWPKQVPASRAVGLLSQMLSSSALQRLGSGLLAASSLHRSPGVFSFDIPMDSQWHYQFRIIMLGDSTVGKSSLLKRYTEGVFLESINQTVGVDFYVQFMEIEPGVQVKLQFWDTAGQERFR